MNRQKFIVVLGAVVVLGVASSVSAASVTFQNLTAAFSNVAGQLRAGFDTARNLWAIQGDVNGDGRVDFQLYVSTGAGPPPVADIIL